MEVQAMWLPQADEKCILTIWYVNSAKICSGPKQKLTTLFRVGLIPVHALQTNQIFICLC